MGDRPNALKTARVHGEVCSNESVHLDSSYKRDRGDHKMNGRRTVLYFAEQQSFSCLVEVRRLPPSHKDTVRSTLAWSLFTVVIILPLFFLLAAGLSHAQFPAKLADLKVVTSEIHPDVKLSYKQVPLLPPCAYGPATGLGI